MTDKEVHNLKDMIGKIETQNNNTKYLYKNLSKEIDGREVIEWLYHAHSYGDKRVTDPDQIYLLFTDISKGELNSFRINVYKFLMDKSSTVATIYMIDSYIDLLEKATKNGKNDDEIKAINNLNKKLGNFKKEIGYRLERSGIISFSDKERKILSKYANEEFLRTEQS